MKRLRSSLSRIWDARPRIIALAMLIAAALIFVIGLARIYEPLGYIAAAGALLAVLTFDSSKAGRLTWPR